MPRKGRKPIIKKREDVRRQRREERLAELEYELHTAYRAEPVDVPEDWDEREQAG